MNILIAHPKQAFIDSAVNIFGLQKANHLIAAAHSLAELVDKIVQSSFHLVLIDGDLIDGGTAAFFGVLSALRDETDLIVTVEENSRLIEELEGFGVFKVIPKSNGYLTALHRTIRQVLDKSAASSTVGAVQAGHSQNQIPVLDEDKSFICDRRGRFLSVSEAVERISGYSAEELAHLSLTDLLPSGQEAAFYRRLFECIETAADHSFAVELRDKYGKVHAVQLRIRLITVEGRPEHVVGFRGTLQEIEAAAPKEPTRIDQMEMVGQFIALVHNSYSQPLSLFLRRIVEVTCQLFRFRRSTLALLDNRSQAFIKQALVGYSEEERKNVEHRTPEVPRDVIDRIFEGRYRIKVIYHQRREKEHIGDEAALLPDRRSQRRPAADQWHKRDLVLLNLKDYNGTTFGYISMDEPQPDMQPNRNLFYNLDLFSRLISLAIENYYRFNSLAKRNRRLHQILADCNIFKLQLNLTDILNETVWAAKNTLDLNLVCIALINKKSQRLELKSVACEDAVKQAQLLELSYEVPVFGRVLKDEYRLGKSYFVKQEENVLRHMKQIYYGADLSVRRTDGWNPWQLLVVPIRGTEEKIIGFLLADDPVYRRTAVDETVDLLEIIANQIAVAIKNRMLYVEARDRAGVPAAASAVSILASSSVKEDEEEESRKGIRRLVDRFLR